MTSIEQQIQEITKDGKGTFVNFQNTEDFTVLDADTREFLKVYGVYNDEYAMPPIITDGQLRVHNNELIMFAEDDVRQKYCIKTSTNEVVLLDVNNRAHIINTSIRKLVESQYTLALYLDTIEAREVFGAYQENHVKYAANLKLMLEQVEPQIMNLAIWSTQIEERENGVI